MAWQSAEAGQHPPCFPPPVFPLPAAAPLGHAVLAPPACHMMHLPVQCAGPSSSALPASAGHAHTLSSSALTLCACSCASSQATRSSARLPRSCKRPTAACRLPTSCVRARACASHTGWRTHCVCVCAAGLQLPLCSICGTQLALCNKMLVACSLCSGLKLTRALATSALKCLSSAAATAVPVALWHCRVCHRCSAASLSRDEAALLSRCVIERRRRALNADCVL